MLRMHTSSLEWAAPPSVQPWVSRLWAASSTHGSPGIREHVLPSGHMHLVLRLSGPPLRVFTRCDAVRPTVVQGPVIGGARSRFYVKELSGNVVTVGAVLRPGASLALFGVSADELAEQHTALHDLWGGAADSLHAQLCDVCDPHARLRLLVDALYQRCAGAKVPSRQLQLIVACLSRDSRIRALAHSSGVSHKSFIHHFRQATGLAPKQFARMMRFRQVLDALSANPAQALVDVALQCGFSDQAHLTREFRAIAGVTPSEYRALAPANASHVPQGKLR